MYTAISKQTRHFNKSDAQQKQLHTRNADDDPPVDLHLVWLRTKAVTIFAYSYYDDQGPAQKHGDTHHTYFKRYRSLKFCNYEDRCILWWALSNVLILWCAVVLTILKLQWQIS